MTIDDRERAFEREVLRVNERYLVEVVEALSLCPFARAAREAGLVRRVCLPQTGDSIGPALLALAAADATGPDEVAVALLIFPRFMGGLASYSRLGERLETAYVARFGAARQFVGVVFHPEYPALDATSAQVVQLIRRSPDPMMQWTRRSILDDVKRALPPGPIGDGSVIRTDADSSVVRRIAAGNVETVRRMGGVAGIERMLAAIRADRDAAYARIAGVNHRDTESTEDHREDRRPP